MLTDIYGSSRSNPKYRLEESGSIGTENTDPFVAMLLDVVGETSRTVGRLLVRSSQDFIIGSEMVQSLRLTRYSISDRETRKVRVLEIAIHFHSKNTVIDQLIAE